MNKLVKKVSASKLTLEFLNTLNGILDLTPRELQLLNLLIKLDLSTTKMPKNIINTENRKYIRQTLQITPDNLSRYISKFKQRGILIYNKDRNLAMVNKALIPEVIGDRIQVIIVLKIDKDGEVETA